MTADVINNQGCLSLKVCNYYKPRIIQCVSAMRIGLIIRRQYWCVFNEHGSNFYKHLPVLNRDILILCDKLKLCKLLDCSPVTCHEKISNLSHIMIGINSYMAWSSH